MANNIRTNADRGMMSVPRSFPADQHSFLVKLLAYVQRLGGSVRGDNLNRAVRHSEMNAFGGREAVIRESGVATKQLADGAVTTEKLADNAVTGKKIEQGAITERELRAGAVTSEALAANSVTGDKMADGAVSLAKLAPGVAVTFVRGEAVDGESVSIPGTWLAPPVVAMTNFALPLAAGASSVGVSNVRAGAVEGTWEFDAVGAFGWLAIGREISGGLNAVSDVLPE